MLQCFVVCCSVIQMNLQAPLATHSVQGVQSFNVFSACVQCAAECCSVLQCVEVCCSVLQGVAGCCRVLPGVAGCCSVLQCVAV